MGRLLMLLLNLLLLEVVEAIAYTITREIQVLKPLVEPHDENYFYYASKSNVDSNVNSATTDSTSSTIALKQLLHQAHSSSYYDNLFFFSEDADDHEEEDRIIAALANCSNTKNDFYNGNIIGRKRDNDVKISFQTTRLPKQTKDHPMHDRHNYSANKPKTSNNAHRNCLHDISSPPAAEIIAAAKATQYVIIPKQFQITTTPATATSAAASTAATRISTINAAKNEKTFRSDGVEYQQRSQRLPQRAAAAAAAAATAVAA